MFIVQLESGVWLTRGKGDPSRTLVKECATQYKTKSSAKAAMTRARKYRPFLSAVIEEVEK